METLILIAVLSFTTPPWQEDPPVTCFIIADENGTVSEICLPAPPTESPCVTDTCPQK